METEPRIFKAKSVNSIYRLDYGVDAPATMLELEQAYTNGPTGWLETGEVSKEPNLDVDLTFVRKTVVYAQSDPLTLADETIDPVLEPVCGSTIEMDAVYNGLVPGMWMIISGERLDLPGASSVKDSELVMVSGVKQDVEKIDIPVLSPEFMRTGMAADVPDLPGDKLHTFVNLASATAYVYKRDTVTLYGNVVKATHGETKDEILGSGDASVPFQSFPMSQSPLTYIAAPTARGAESTLQIWVDNVLWHEAESLADMGPKDRGYVTFVDNDDKITIVSGNGTKGVRPPTGSENIEAIYRVGIGKQGNVDAGQISLPITKPLGVKGVINPIRASGGADEESMGQIRTNATLALMALDRLVSIQDYADFARAFAGIGKATSNPLYDGSRNVVYITIAGSDDAPVDKSSDLYRNLSSALHDLGDPNQPILLGARELVLLMLKANVKILHDRRWENVEAAVRSALFDAFGFDNRELGQDVFLSEVISTIKGVEGVDYVDVDIFDGLSDSSPPEEFINILAKLGGADQPKQLISVKGARAEMDPGSNTRVIKPAQIAIFSQSPALKDNLVLHEVKT
jgi:hypothetical protein